MVNRTGNLEPRCSCWAVFPRSRSSVEAGLHQALEASCNHIQVPHATVIASTPVRITGSRVGSKGFTIVELLVVITIVFLLSGLVLLVGVPVIGGMVDHAIMQRRGEQIVAGLSQYQTVDGLDRGLAVINGATGRNLRFGTLREVLQRLIRPPPHGCGGNLATLSRRNTPPDLPPNIGTQYEAAKLARQRNPANAFNIPEYPITNWVVKGTGIDDVITFRNRTITQFSDVRPGTGGLPENERPVGVGWMADHYADIIFRPNNYPSVTGFGRRDKGGGRLGESTYAPWSARFSPIGETLDGTLEVIPDGMTVWPTTTYYDRWPNLSQINKVVGGVNRYDNQSWPISDWNNPTAGTIPVIWPFPWGSKILRRRAVLLLLDQVEGLVPQGDINDLSNTKAWLDPVDPAGGFVVRLGSDGKNLSVPYLAKARSADCLSPLATFRLLAMAGIVTPGTDGENAYRTLRGRNLNWNDRWGQPLVLGFAAFIAPRYDFDDVNELTSYTYYSTDYGILPDELLLVDSATLPLPSSKLLGGRDLLLKTIKKQYGTAWEGYLCLGSTGPADRGTPFSTSWEANDDRSQLVQRWMMITTTCAAWEWHQFAFTSPPGAWSRVDPAGGQWKVEAWSKNGFRKGVLGNKQTCYLMAPVPIR